MNRPPPPRWPEYVLPALLLLWCLTALLGAQWRPVEPAGLTDPRALAPSLTHPLGTDTLGRDLLARLLEGMRTTLLVGLGATLMALSLGTLYGTAAGMAGPRTDEALMRGVDVALALPYLLLVILLVSLLGRSLGLLLIALALIEWLPMARLVRAGVHSLREEPYLEAARIMGALPGRVLRTHLLPQLRAPLVVYATLMLPVVMMQEAFLSFLGLGVPPPLASWGTLIAEGLATVGDAPWILWSAAGSLALFLLCLHAAGDQLARRRGLPRWRGAPQESRR